MKPNLNVQVVARDLLNLKAFKEWMHTNAGDQTIFDFCQALANAMGSRAKYSRVCAQAEKYVDTMTLKNLQTGLAFLRPMQAEGRPGHDYGHRLRDELRTAALLADPIVQNCQYSVEKFGLLVSGPNHDAITGISTRWQDWNMRCGHGERGAFAIFVAFEHLPLPVRMVLAYLVLTHTNFPSKVVKQPEGFQRPKWWADMWKGKRGYIGVASEATKGADRGDNMSVFLVVRHILSAADTVIEGGGQNILGGSESQTYNIDEFSLLQSLVLRTYAPIERDGNPAPQGKGYPTTLTHVLGYMNSALAENIYSRHDGKFVVLSQMLATSMRGFVDTVMTARLTPKRMPVSQIKARMKKVFYMVSLCKRSEFERAWKLISKTFDTLSYEDKMRWGTVMDTIVQNLVNGCQESYFLALQSGNEIAVELAKDAWTNLKIEKLAAL